MKKIALIGNIASGKSIAFEVIKNLNYPVIDCDDIVKDLYKEKSIIDLLSVNFPEIITDNQIDAKKLSDMIFFNKDKKRRFELIIHPFVKEKITLFFELNKNKDKAFVVIPLLFEAKMDPLFDIKVMISSDAKIREERLIQRNTILSNYAKEVINAQMPDIEKEKLCDYVIKNNGTIEEFKNHIKKCVTKL